MSPQDTIVAVSSAPGPAPRGVLRVAGPQAFARVAALVVEPVDSESSTPQGQPVPHALIERRRGAYEGVALALPEWPPVPALVLAFAAPHSYSGDDVVELHLPGSPVLLAALLAELLRYTPEVAGPAVRYAEPGEFTLRALLNGKLDLTQAEAVSEVIGAREPEAAVRELANLTAGRGENVPGAPAHSLAALAATWRERLGTLMARAELALDFSEDEDFWHVADPPRLQRELSEVCEEILARSKHRRATAAERGEAPEVVLLGPANAGKSSLLNALAGGRRSIVTRIPGTTRDAVSHEVTLPQGPRVRLWDTAGLRRATQGHDAAGEAAEPPLPADKLDSERTATAHALDAAAEDLSLEMVRGADVLVWCWPADVAPPVIPVTLQDMCGSEWLLNRTKSDLPASWSLEEYAARYGGVASVSTSVRDESSLAAFGRTVAEALAAAAHGNAEHGGHGVLANARQAAHLEAAAHHLEQALPLAQHAETMELASHEMASAERELAHLLGEDPVSGVANEALLTRIFSTFCLGK